MRKTLELIPNMLTVARILSAPLIFFLMLYHELNHNHTHQLWAVILLIMVFALVSDFADGYVSRKWNIESHLGAMLDPIADKVLVIVLLFASALVGLLTVPGYIAAMLIIIREVLLSGVREYTARFNIRLPSSGLAKWKTVLQMAALFLIFIEHHLTVFYMFKLGEYLLFCATIVTLITGWQYMRTALRQMRQI